MRKNHNQLLSAATLGKYLFFFFFQITVHIVASFISVQYPVKYHWHHTFIVQVADILGLIVTVINMLQFLKQLKKNKYFQCYC